MLAYIRATWQKHRCIGPFIGRALLTVLAALVVRALRAYLARQGSIVYRPSHKAAPGAPL
jgi:hypothetical protein